MAHPRAAWGIEIGADAIKAIRLERDGKDVSVTDFAVIPHKKILTTPDLDEDEMVRVSLGQFISQKSLEGEHLVMSVPGHAAFARFAKLPPVEPKKVPDIVKFEAVQQIPFPIDEVEWDYQTFQGPDSPEIEVGIFAITRDRVQRRLSVWGELGVSPETLTLSPVAVYNAMAYDRQLAAGEPVIFLDIGTQATDVIIADGEKCWIRTFPLGGTHFTEAIASAFKLSYSKAEKLKKEASTSKYAKQIMQAMRPVFSDLLQDIQRSIGYYDSVHRDQELGTVVGLGSTFKIPGLRKFIGQQLQINVVRLDEFRRIAVTGREASAFAEHAVNMATAYGCALQGVGLAPIAANLVPVKILREQAWHAKTKWFAAAALIFVAGAASTLYHPLVDGGKLAPAGDLRAVADVERTASDLKDKYDQAKSSASVGFTGENMIRLTDYRSVWPTIVNDVSLALAATSPQPELLGDNEVAIRAMAPETRRLVQLKHLGGDYIRGEGNTRQIHVTVNVELSHANPAGFLNDTVGAWLRDNAEPAGDRAEVPYRIVADTISLNPQLRQEFTVTDAGVEETKGAGGGTGRGGQRPPAGQRQPPAGGGSAGGAGAPPGLGGAGFGAGGGGTGGGSRGRRSGPPSGSASAPGSGVGAGLGAGGGAGPGFGGAGGAPPGRRTPGGTSGPVGGGSTGSAVTVEAESHADLDKYAPMPKEPSLYPPGAKFYRLPITFTIEILDPRAPKPVNTAASDATKTDGDNA